MFDSTIMSGLQLAFKEAKNFCGATAPNPPVGAAGLNSAGQIIALAAHQKAGTAHAEAQVIEECRKKGILSQLNTLVITLEPCNHHGKTPPCTEAILNAAQEGGLRRVYFGVQDPNTHVAGKGANRLREAGLEVFDLNDHECQQLIAPFSHWIQTGRPWVVLKTAFNSECPQSSLGSLSSIDSLASLASLASMIPPPGQKTFSSYESLCFAHQIRRSSDAILTGSGTVLIDQPEFTVRLCPDHPQKKRWLVVLDRRRRTPKSWIESREKAGFQVQLADDVDAALNFLGSQGVLQVLVETGPILTSTFLSRSLWNEHVVITPGGIEIRKCLQESFKK